jgi:hypothetical protein
LQWGEKKFKNFTVLSLETFDFIFNLIRGKIRRKDANYRRRITAEQRLLFTLK